MDDERLVVHGTEKTLEALREIVQRTRDAKLAAALRRIEQAVKNEGRRLDYVDYEPPRGKRVLLSVDVPGFPLMPGVEGETLEEAFREMARHLEIYLNPNGDQA